MFYDYNKALQDSIEYFKGDDLAAKVWLDKYALRDNDGNLLEDTPDKMHRRIAKEFARIEKGKFKEPLSEDEIFDLLDGFKYIVCQGSPMFGIGNDYQYVTLSNCYVLTTPNDSYNSLLATDHELVSISKRRGGTGIDLSLLRPRGSGVKNAAKTSTGTPSWMERYSNSTREVGQSNRRGALMLTISIHHPDSVIINEEEWKNPKQIIIHGDKSKGERDIVTDSRFYDPNNLDFASIKLDRRKVTGANVSFRFSDEFLDAVKNGEKYEQRFPVDYKEKGIKPLVSKMVDARKVWQKIIHLSWQSAEPGGLFWDNIINNNAIDCYKDFGFETKSCNPCCHSVSEDVFVKTKNGLKEIKSITSEDEVLVINSFTGRKQYVETSGYFKSGNSDIFKVEFSNGQKLYVTLNHKFATGFSHNSRLILTPLAILLVGSNILNEEGCYVEITSISYYKTDEVGCINVPRFGYFVLDSGLISGNSELPLCELDSCRLLIQNLFSYVKDPFTNKAEFDFDLFNDHAIIAQRLMDDLIDLELEKIDKILKKMELDPESQETKDPEIKLWNKIREKCQNGRRTGLGITATGDTLAALGIKYGSNESINIVEKIHKTQKLASFKSSMLISKDLGPFPIWNWELEKDSKFLLQIKTDDPELYNNIKKYGRRNIGNLTLAPTGSCSVLTQTTSGIEPLFNLEPYKRRKKINYDDKTSKVDFVDGNGDQWQEFTVYHPKVKLWMEITGETDLKKSPWYNCCANDIDWKQRVKLQAAIQRHIDHSISSTLNLPNNVTEDKVKEIFETAWESGCKGITVYRDGCRSGVLVRDNKQTDKITQTKAPKRPKTINGELHHLTVNKMRYYVAVGLYEGDPYEIFAGINHNNEGDIIIPKKVHNGKIEKVKRGYYNFIDDENNEYHLSNGNSDETVDALTRILSSALRHGTGIHFLVHQLEKTQGPMLSFSKVLARTLKKYIKDGTEVNGEECPNCGGKLTRQEGCVSCSCGFSKC